jgi:hypothetical protein
MAKAKTDLKNILVLIAGILLIIQGVQQAISGGNFIIDGVIGGILSILLGIVLLMISGFITNKVGIPLNLITSIIFCVLCFIFGSWWAGILMVIVVILFVLNK